MNTETSAVPETPVEKVLTRDWKDEPTSAILLYNWLVAISAGDRSAFEQLYRAYSARVFGLLLQLLRRRDWAEQALHDCFLRVWQNSDTFDPTIDAPTSWLLALTRTPVLDELRLLNPEVEPAEEGEAAAAAATTVEFDERSALHAAKRLADESQEICNCGLTSEGSRCLMLAYYGGYTHRTLAQAMNIPLGTSKQRVRRELLNLHEYVN